MKKRVNLRLPVISACALACGIACGYAFAFYRTDLIWIAVAIPVFAIPCIIFICAFKNFKPLVICLAAAVFFFAGAVSSNLKIADYNMPQTDGYGEQAVYICGTVREKSATSNGEYIILKNASADGKKLKYDILCYLGDGYGDFCDNGYKVEFYSSLTAADAFVYGKLNSNAENNIKYTCSVNGGLKSEYKFSLFGTLRAQIRKTLFDNLDYDSAAVCYGMLTGETAFIDDESMQSFRYGGIAHIFAVSGLHISIVFGLLGLLCKKLRVNKFIGAAVCVTGIIIYSGVCGFTLSSVRAAIMCTVAAISKLIYVKNDGMNSLAIAVTAILLVSPLSLFSAGFRLSVSAVGGILIFSVRFAKSIKKIKPPQRLIDRLPNNKFRKALGKIAIPEKIASAAGVTLAAQAGTLPVMLSTFGYISGAGLILNIIVIPLVSALFSILFFCTLICCIITPLSPFLMPVAVAPLDGVISFLINGGFEKALIKGFGAGLFIPLYYLGVLVLSDKLNIKTVTRIVATACSAVILISYVLCAVYLPVNGYKIFVSAYKGGGDVIVKSANGTVLIVTDYINSSYITTDLSKFYSANLDGVVILGDEESVLNFGNSGLSCTDVFCFSGNAYMQPFGGITVHYADEFALCGINFKYENGYTVSVNCGGVNMCVCASNVATVNSCDLLVSLYEKPECRSDYKVYFNSADYEYNVYEYGDITFTVKNGNLKINGLLPDIVSLKR